MRIYRRIIFIISLFVLLLLLCFVISGYLVLNTNSRFNTPTPTKSPTPTPSQIPTPTSTLTPTPTPTPRPFSTLTPIPTIVTSQSLEGLFAKYGNQYNVDPQLLKRIADCESGFNPNTVTDDYAGLFQFASFAWVEARGRMGLNNDQNLRFNAEESIRTAAFEINYKGTSGWSDCDK